MALNKLKFNSLNVTPVAGKTVGFNSSANGLEATISGGAMTFIKKLTADNSGTNLSFVHGSSSVVLDSTYKEYIFIVNNLHTATDNVQFKVGFRDGETNYDAVKTTTHFQAYHSEDDSQAGITYATGEDLAQSSDLQFLAYGQGNLDDESISGILHLFNPSSTTFVKHFIARFSNTNRIDYAQDTYTAGYCNTTTAIDGVKFEISSGNLESGTITLYGIN